MNTDLFQQVAQDKRYTAYRRGQDIVLRFCGDNISIHKTMEGAINAALHHKKQRELLPEDIR